MPGDVSLCEPSKRSSKGSVPPWRFAAKRARRRQSLSRRRSPRWLRSRTPQPRSPRGPSWNRNRLELERERLDSEPERPDIEQHISELEPERPDIEPEPTEMEPERPKTYPKHTRNTRPWPGAFGNCRGSAPLVRRASILGRVTASGI